MDWANPEYEMCYWAGRSDCTPELANQVNDVLQEYYQAGKTLVIKSPSNLMRTLLLDELFHEEDNQGPKRQRAYHIIIVRNPYANVPSIIDSRMHDERYPHIPSQLTTVEQAARHCFYASYLMLSLQFQLPDEVKIVRYEDMVKRPDLTFGGILRFCHLDEDFPPPLVETTRNQERIGQLGDYEIKVITQICGPMLQHFCYDRLGPKSKWHNH
ncbi:sulfotransferase [Candidatus Woesearchaeota archaeon]|nr:sulfotransferase [Candidatus Woesearchaeota archaeon]